MPTTYNSDGSRADVQAKINAASDGDTVTIPAGSFTWASGVTISGKGVHLQGAGSGRVVARSRSSVAFGTGTKTFTIQSGASIANGTTLRIWQTATDKDSSYMLGTVTSLSGTALEMNVTSNTGAGTKTLWLFATEATTTITHSAGASALVALTEDASNTVELSGIQFLTGTGSGKTVTLAYTANGKPVQVHDCWFALDAGTLGIESTSTTRAIIYDCSFTWTSFAESNTQAIHMPVNSRTEVWSAVSTMGTADATGGSNFYFEDCDVHAAQGFIDMDSNAKVVVRNCVLNSAGVSSHGYDTSSFGVRHWEIYDNRFEFANVGNDSLNLINHILVRGGTGVITGNYFENITSQAWGDKAELQFGVWGLGRWSQAPGAYSADDSCVQQYPMPRQFGFGYVTGSGVDGQGNSVSNSVYVGDSEPAYVWSNTGDVPAISITTDGTACVLNEYGHIPDNPADYIQSGRDYFLNAGAKPGWTAYTYPHPLRTNQSTMVAPTFSPDGGTYETTQSVTLSTTSTYTGATIRYTTDGSTPNSRSTMYTTPISVSTTQVIKGIVTSEFDGYIESTVSSATYIIDPPPDIVAFVVTTLVGVRITLTCLLFCFFLSGCFGTPKRPSIVTPTITTTPTTVELKGDAQIPAKVDTKKTESTLTIPEGSRFEFNDKLNTLSLTLARATTMTTQRHEQAITGPVAFMPDKAPTVQEISDAKQSFWVGLGLKAGLAFGSAAAVFGLVRDWNLVMYGGAAIAAACAFGLFVEKHPILLMAIGLGVAAVVIAPILWYSKIKPLENKA